MERFHARQQSFKASRGRYASADELAKRASDSGRGANRFSGGSWVAFGYGFRFEGSETRFSLTATPTHHPRSGRVSFYIDETGTLRGEDKNGAPAGREDKQ